MKTLSNFLLLILFSFALSAQNAYWVATDGNNNTGNGSTENPWADITYALDQVSDKDTIIVKPGTYYGRIRLRGEFENGVVVKAQVPYESKLRNNGTVITCYYGKGITIEGFDIAHDGAGAGALVFQVQDLRGEVGDNDYTSRITIKNNILHDSYNNDILKINNGAKDIFVDGNLFYNQEGSDEHIDINSVENITVQNNIFMNDFGGSGRTNDNSTSSYIVVKDSNEDNDKIIGANNITIQKNIFMNWEGSSGQGFIRLGEDGKSYHEAREITVQNNLMLGNSSNTIRSPFQIMNCKQVTFRHNTIHGDMPAKEFGSRIFTYGSNAPTNDSITITGNIWSDPTGTMSDVYNRGNNTNNLFFHHNLHWNGGNSFPTSGESIIEVSSDNSGLTEDPLLPTLNGIILPRYNETTNEFTDGSKTITEAFRNIVVQYGMPENNSPVLGNAAPLHAPVDDILGNARDVNKPDIGAVELQGAAGINKQNIESPVYYDPINKRIRITKTSAPQIKEMVLYDINGKLLEVSQTDIDLANRLPGLYIVRGIHQSGEYFSLKFIHVYE
jgi:hypothetical protein